jgi:hypothetical protein
VKTTTAITLSTLLTLGSGLLVLPETAGAEGFGPMNMMNPSKWFGGRDRDYDDDYYGDPGYGPPPPGYGAPPPPGVPGYGGYGYAPPPPAGGYGYTPPVAPAPGYSPPAAPAYTSPAGGIDSPSSGVDPQTRIQELEDRIRQLESMQQPGGAPSGAGYGGYQPGSTTGGGYQPSSGSSYQPGSLGSDYPSIPPSGTYEPSSPVFRPAD